MRRRPPTFRRRAKGSRLRALCLASTCLVQASCGEGPPPPSVVVVLLDTLRPDHLGCYGYERDTSPRLDAMADEFFLFENAQSTAPWTAPALISLMTSLYPDQHGVVGTPDPGRLSERAVTLAELLRNRGYATFAVTEGGYARGQFGLDQGFDEYHSLEKGDSDRTTERMPDHLDSNLDRAIEWLGRQEGPFLLFFHTFEVHTPRIAEDELLRRFRPGHDPERFRASVRAAVRAWNERNELDAEAAELMLRESLGAEFAGMRAPSNPPALLEAAAEEGVSFQKVDVVDSPELVGWVRDLYDAEIRRTDAQLTRLWDALREAGRWEDTIVVLASDHGEGLGDHGRLGHGGTLHEELLRMLLMIRAPGAGHPPRRVPELVRSVDLMPTLLELTGTPPAAFEGLDMQGVSLVPLMAGEPLELEAYSHALNSNHGEDVRHTIRTASWRLIHDSRTGRTRLYDLRADPRELVDVSAREPEVVRRLMEQLERRRRADAELAARLGTGDSEGLDDATLRELQALGYAGEDE